MSGTADSLTGDATRHFLQTRTEDGWGAFVEHYGRTMHRWAMGCWRLGEDEASELTQRVVVKLWEKMRRPDAALWDPEKGRFHAWLKQVARNAWYDARVSWNGAGDGRKVLELLDNDAICKDFVEKLAQQEIFDFALKRTEQRVPPAQWEVFRLVRLENLSGNEVASRTSKTPETVHNYTSAVGKVFQEEWRRLVDTDEAGSEVGP